MGLTLFLELVFVLNCAVLKVLILCTLKSQISSTNIPLFYNITKTNLGFYKTVTSSYQIRLAERSSCITRLTFDWPLSGSLTIFQLSYC